MPVRVFNDLLVHQVDVLPEGPCGGAVVAGEKLVDGPIGVIVGVPHRLGDDPGPEFRPFRGRREVARLLVQPLHAVVDEEPDVRLQGPQVRKRHDAVVVVDDVVPDVQAVANSVPRPDVVHERLVVRVGLERVGEAALDAAQPHAHVRTGLHVLRRLSGVLIRKRRDDLAGVVLRDVVGDGVDEVQERSSLAAFLLGERCALFARAVVVPVVLRDRKDRGLWGVLDPPADRFPGRFEDLRVRQTQLRPPADALALHLGKPFRMVLEVLVGREDRVECVDEVRVSDLAAALLVQTRMRAVHLVADGPIRVARAGVVRVAVFERRCVANREVGDLEPPALRNPAAIRREPPAVTVILQERVHRVQHAALVAREDQGRSLRLDGNAFKAEGIEIDLDAEFLERLRAPAYQDRRLLAQPALGRHGQPLAGHLLDVVREVPGRVPLLRRASFRNDDSVGGRRNLLSAYRNDALAGAGGLAGPPTCGDEKAYRSGKRKFARESVHR